MHHGATMHCMLMSLGERSFRISSQSFFSPQDYVLHPYLSMQQMNDVKAENIKGFVIGSSNMLFKHQSHVSWDVLVDVSIIGFSVGLCSCLQSLLVKIFNSNSANLFLVKYMK